jgi:hypothetical protein
MGRVTKNIKFSLPAPPPNIDAVLSINPVHELSRILK